MKRRSQGRQKRAPAPYTKYRKTPHKYADWIEHGGRPPRGSLFEQLANRAKAAR